MRRYVASTTGEERRNDIAGATMKRERRKGNSVDVLKQRQLQSTTVAGAVVTRRRTSSWTCPPSAAPIAAVVAVLQRMVVVLAVTAFLDRGHSGAAALSSCSSSSSSLFAHRLSSRFQQLRTLQKQHQPPSLLDTPSTSRWEGAGAVSTAKSGERRFGTARSTTRLNMFMGSDGGLLGVGGPEIVSAGWRISMT